MQWTIAILGGTGNQGLGLALRWAQSGQNIIIGSRQREKAVDAAKRAIDILGGNASINGMENPEAAKKANIVVLSVPFAAQFPILDSVKDHIRKDAIYVDLTVPLATAIGGKATKTIDVWAGSAAEQAASILPKDIPVVSAFNNLSAEALQDLKSIIDCDVIVCGGNKDTKKVIMDLVRLIPGARAVDGGPLENARIVEKLTALLIGLNIRYKSDRAGIRITGICLP